MIIPVSWEDTGQVTDQVTDQVNDQVNDQVIKVLNYCKKAKTRVEILEFLGYKNHFDNYKRYIESLLQNGYIQFTIPENPRHRNQKYIITEKGKEVLRMKKK